jgi:hypothetical protein
MPPIQYCSPSPFAPLMTGLYRMRAPHLATRSATHAPTEISDGAEYSALQAGGTDPVARQTRSFRRALVAFESPSQWDLQ